MDNFICDRDRDGLSVRWRICFFTDEASWQKVAGMDIGRAGCPWCACDLVQSRICTRLGGGCARNARIQCHVRSGCGVFDRKGHPAIHEKIRRDAVSQKVEFFTERQEFSFERRNTYYFKMKAFSIAGR